MEEIHIGSASKMEALFNPKKFGLITKPEKKLEGWYLNYWDNFEKEDVIVHFTDIKSVLDCYDRKNPLNEYQQLKNRIQLLDSIMNDSFQADHIHRYNEEATISQFSALSTKKQFLILRYLAERIVKEPKLKEEMFREIFMVFNENNVVERASLAPSAGTVAALKQDQ